MSGNAPDWIKPGHYILFHGEKTVVNDYHFVSAPGPNCDTLVVQLKGHAAKEFNAKSMRPLPAEKFDHVPAHIREGAVVELRDGRLDMVTRVWVSQEEGKLERTVMVDLDSYPFPQSPADLYAPKDQTAVAALLQRKLAEETRRNSLKAMNQHKNKRGF